jgi:hypothetical protein
MRRGRPRQGVRRPSGPRGARPRHPGRRVRGGGRALGLRPGRDPAGGGPGGRSDRPPRAAGTGRGCRGGAGRRRSSDGSRGGGQGGSGVGRVPGEAAPLQGPGQGVGGLAEQGPSSSPRRSRPRPASATWRCRRASSCSSTWSCWRSRSTPHDAESVAQADEDRRQGARQHHPVEEGPARHPVADPAGDPVVRHRRGGEAVSRGAWGVLPDLRQHPCAGRRRSTAGRPAAPPGGRGSSATSRRPDPSRRARW